MDEDRIEYERMKTQLYEAQVRARHMETLMETKDKDIMKTKEVRAPFHFINFIVNNRQMQTVR